MPRHPMVPDMRCDLAPCRRWRRVGTDALGSSILSIRRTRTVWEISPYAAGPWLAGTGFVAVGSSSCKCAEGKQPRSGRVGDSGG